MTDEEITKSARQICAEYYSKEGFSSGSQSIIDGDCDDTLWMRLIKQGVRKGIEIGKESK
jgi:hypothetical protein